MEFLGTTGPENRSTKWRRRWIGETSEKREGNSRESEPLRIEIAKMS